MKTVYVVTEDKIKISQDSCRTAYGIGIVTDGVILRNIPDIFTDKDTAAALAELCNKLELSPSQIDDVIYDTLSSI